MDLEEKVRELDGTEKKEEEKRGRGKRERSGSLKNRDMLRIWTYHFRHIISHELSAVCAVLCPR